MNCFFFGTVIRTFMVYMLKSCDWPGDETRLSQWIKLLPLKQGNTSFQQRLREVHTLYMYMLFNCPLLTSGCPSLKIRWMTKQAFHPTMWERRKGNCFITFQNELHPLSLHVAIRVPGTTRQETQQVVTILINLCHTPANPNHKASYIVGILKEILSFTYFWRVSLWAGLQWRSELYWELHAVGK